MSTVAVARRVDGWLFGAESGARLRVTIAGLAALLGARIALGPYRGLAGQPAALFRPPLVLGWLHAMPPLDVIVAVQVVGTVAACLAIVGWRYRAFLLVAWVSLLLLGGLRESRGKLQHNDVLILLVVVPFLLAPLGARWRDRLPSPRFGWPIRTALVVIAAAYFFTGFGKLLSSGPAWVFSDNMQMILFQAAENTRAPTDVVALFIAQRPVLSVAVAAATLVIELGAPAILFRPRLRPLFVVCVAGLHTTIWFTHGLDYFMWVGVVAVVLIDWPAVVARARRSARPGETAGRSLPVGSGRSLRRAAGRPVGRRRGRTTSS